MKEPVLVGDVHFCLRNGRYVWHTVLKTGSERRLVQGAVSSAKELPEAVLGAHKAAVEGLKR